MRPTVASAHSAGLAKAQDLARFEGIAGRVPFRCSPITSTTSPPKLHCMLVMYDPELRNEETPWPELRRMLRELIQPYWSVIEPQSRIRLLRPKTERDAAAGGNGQDCRVSDACAGFEGTAAACGARVSFTGPSMSCDAQLYNLPIWRTSSPDKRMPEAG
ncbi:hypothetical protein [Rhizobium nepotum]|uniref:hypothetical protein n=1 Tax=Rhizobium nepotum TaxID=1035271 RepID=UPI003CF66A50